MSTLICNTLLLIAGSIGLSLPLGTLLGWLIFRTDVGGRRLAMALLAAMLFVPLYLQAAAWQAAFGLQGAFALWLHSPIWLEGMPGAIWVHGLAAVPPAALLAGVAMQAVAAEWEEMARLEASPAQVFLHVTLRLARPALVIAALWAAVVAATEIVVTDLYAVRTFAEEVYTQFALGGDAWEVLLRGPSALVTLALAAGGLALIVALRPRHWELSRRPARPLRLGGWRWPLTALLGAGLLLVVGVPLVSLVWKAGIVVVQTEQGLSRSWSPWKCAQLIAQAPWRFRRELGWTFVIGALAATAAVLTAIPLAWWARRGGWSSAPAVLAAAFGLAIPGPVLGLLLILLFDGPHSPSWLVWCYGNTIVAPWLAQYLRALPLAILVLWHAMQSIPRELEDLAALDGVGRVGRLWRVALPARRRAAAVAWILAFAAAAGELSASMLVAPPGVNTLANRVFSLLHYGVDDQVAAICLSGATLAMLACVAVWLLWRTAARVRGAGEV